MSLYVIGDLHLSFGIPDKTMDIFRGWDNYQQLIERNWVETVKNEDTVVLAGDTSWGMSLEQADADFAFLERLPGRKILLKGNHDYWWTTMNKMTEYIQDRGFTSLSVLHNNHFEYEGYGICGTRGWVNMPNEPSDAKVLAREAGRLETSVDSAKKAGLIPIVFMHYPPIFGNSFNYDILEVFYRHDIKQCYYGHIHGNGHSLGVKGEYDGTDYRLISSDYLQFMPEKVL